MPHPSLRALAESFADLPDPRVERTRKHELLDILTIAIFAVVAGADSFTDIEEYGNAKVAWLRTFLALPNGIPSHDTFGRVFALLDPERFAASLTDWVALSVGLASAPHIAVDGKTLRRAHDRAQGKGALHLLSAWATETGISLGQLPVADHENEIVALPALLEQVVLPGAVVSIDAIGCQREVARTITDAGGAYVLALKGNQPELYQAVTELFADPAPGGIAADTVTHDCTVDGGHGRVERRECWAATDPALIAYLDPAGRWPGLQSVVMVQSRRIIGEMTQSETRYYLSSLPADAQRLNALVRTHWRIENQLHWVLDVVFAEDQSRIRSGYADQNFAALRRFVVSLLTQDTSRKLGQHAKRLRAGWDNDYLLQLLTQ
jgi:predicted transposase YbfD/YdcC